MYRILVLALALICALTPALAGTNPQAQQLLVSAAERSNLLEGNGGPFQLELSFEASLSVPTDQGPAAVPATGHLTLKWAGRNTWWRRIEMSGFEETAVRNDEMLYTSRNLKFTPPVANDLIALLKVLRPKGLEVKKQKTNTKDQATQTCFETEYDPAQHRSRQDVCMDDSGNILSVQWRGGEHEQRREQFSDYMDFQGYRLPRTFALLVNGRKTISATVQSLSPATVDPAILIPPKDAVERRQCEDMKQPVPIETPDPLYPESARKRGLNGSTSVIMTVLADGSVGDIQLVGASNTSMLDPGTLRTLRRWKFKPAMCGTEPVVTDVPVVVDFKLG